MTNWVTAVLRTAILNGHFEPNEKIDQESLAKELNVSRTPVREALKELEAESLIENRSYHGSYVTQITRQDISNVYEVRRLLESEIVRQATLLISDTDIDALEKVLNDERSALERNDLDRNASVDYNFHAILAKYCQNSLISEILANINNRLVRVRNFASRRPGHHLQDSLNEHIQIVNCLRERDPEKACQAMAIHLEKSAERIEELIR